MALESMRRAYAAEPVRELIEAPEKAERDERDRIYTAKLEGKVEVVRNALAAGLDRGTILKLTGLSATGLDCFLPEPWPPHPGP